MSNPSREIKKLLDQNKIKNKVTTRGSIITVRLYDRCSDELMEKIEILGDLKNVTQDPHADYQIYEGFAVQFRFEFDLNQNEIDQIYFISENMIDENWVSFMHHFKSKVRDKLGRCVMSRFDYFYEIAVKRASECKRNKGL